MDGSNYFIEKKRAREGGHFELSKNKTPADCGGESG